MNEAEIGVEAPFCQCANCQADPAKAVRVAKSPAGEGWCKYARGHKPATGTRLSNKRDLRLDGIPTDSLFTVKVFSQKQYEAKHSGVDDRILTLLDQVVKGNKDEVTVVYLTAEHAKAMIKQIAKGIEMMGIPVEMTKHRDHVKLVKK